MGLPFTYDNGQNGDHDVHVLLDQAYADEAWKDIFPAARVFDLASSCSDRMPLLVQLERIQDHQRREHSARYEIMWSAIQHFPELITNAWVKNKLASGLGLVVVSLKELMKELKYWSKANFGNVLKEAETLRTQPSELQTAGANHSHIQRKMNQLDELLYREMLFL